MATKQNKNKSKTKTKKYTERKETVEDKKSRFKLLKVKIDEFNDKSDTELIEKSKRIFSDISNEFDEVLSIEYEAILILIEKRNMSKDYSNNSSKYKYYPDYSDDKFNEKIYNKIEFYLNKNYKMDDLSDTETEKLKKQLCDPLYGVDTNDLKNINFNLTKSQKFLKAFLSPGTPYNSMLLYHGTGVGKTCTSISIAEQYSDELERLNKKIIILLNPSIKANFLKNIFNISKLKQGITYYQCTGDKYLQEIPDFDKMPIDILEKKINKIIKNRYEFYGYQQFANLIENIDKEIKETYSEELHHKLFKKKIRSMFSNTVFIIDEVHNIKEGDDLKVLPPLLERVFDLTDDMKLLLLSATPMFDTSREIIYLMNLLLKNDNKLTMNADDYFDKNNNIIKSQISNFVKKTKGYVSYVRGDDPMRFPLGIYPEDDVIKPTDFPIKDDRGIPIKKKDKLKDLKIIACVMNELQKKVYDKVETGKSFGAFNQPALMCSNIVFPVEDEDDALENFKLDTFIGDIGFNNIFSKTKVNKHIKYSYKNPKYKNMFSDEQLKKYSSKIYNIIQNVNKSEDEGIVFIYSQFLASGILPIALALETNGYKKYGSSLFSSKYESKLEDTKGAYIIISGNNDLSKNAYQDYMRIENDNKNGEKVKIIIGSETAAEGLDFKYIRQIHIMEPWFHFNKIDQIIGRGIRNCSHIDLPSFKRNVKIFLYASTNSKIPKNDKETLDLKIYRKSEIKTRQMAEVEYLLKINAVDCNLNKESNKYPTDINGSKKCNYKDCDYKCTPNLKDKLSKDEIDYDTMNEGILEEQINDVIKSIKPLFKLNYHYSLEQLLSRFKIHRQIVFLALHKLITSKKILYDKNDNRGVLIYRNGIYIFVASDIMNKIFTFDNLKSKRTKMVDRLRLNNTTKKMFTDYFGIPERKKYSVVKPSIANTNVNMHINKPNPSIDLNQLIFDKLYNKDRIYSKISDMNENKKTDISKELQNKINTKIYSNGPIIDYVDPSNKEMYIRHLIDNKSKKSLNDDETQILNNCYNILRFKDDVYYKDPSYKGDNSLFGYKIISGDIIKYYKYESSSFSDVTSQETKSIEKSTKKKILEYNSIRPAANLCGYLKYKPSKKEILFKIRDKYTQSGKKGTQVKTGSVCNNDGMHKNTIIKFIQNINIELQKTEDKNNSKKLKKEYNSDKYKKTKKKDIPGKEFLCIELEYYLRYLDIIDKDHRYFYNSEETIEYKLNEK